MRNVSEQMTDWIDVLHGFQEDWSMESNRYKMLAEIIEFLKVKRVGSFLSSSSTAQMALDDPNPLRRLDTIYADLQRFSTRISRAEGSIQELHVETHLLRNRICNLEQR